MITFPRIIIIISLIGVYYLNHRHDKVGFLLFALSASLWAVHSLSIGEYEQMLNYSASAATSLYGFIKWRMDEKKNPRK